MPDGTVTISTRTSPGTVVWWVEEASDDTIEAHSGSVHGVTDEGAWISGPSVRFAWMGDEFGKTRRKAIEMEIAAHEQTIADLCMMLEESDGQPSA